jgi:translation initiation factor 2 alpha subunit (eIF-2alpha)
MTRRLEPWLDRLARRPSPPSPGHRHALEQDLLARFGELHPHPIKESRMPTVTFWRAAMAAAVLAVAAGATQVPAEYQAEIGRRIEITSDAPLGRDKVKAALAAVEGGDHKYVQVRVGVEKKGDGPFVTTIEIFGDTVASGDLAALVRKAVPSLAAVPITVKPIERTVHGDLGDAAAARLAGQKLSPEALARAIEAELKATDPEARVEVQVERGDGTEEVRVRVTKEKKEEATGTRTDGPGTAAPESAPTRP